MADNPFKKVLRPSSKDERFCQLIRSGFLPMNGSGCYEDPDLSSSESMCNTCQELCALIVLMVFFMPPVPKGNISFASLGRLPRKIGKTRWIYYLTTSELRIVWRLIIYLLSSAGKLKIIINTIPTFIKYSFMVNWNVLCLVISVLIIPNIRHVSKDSIYRCVKFDFWHIIKAVWGRINCLIYLKNLYMSNHSVVAVAQYCSCLHLNKCYRSWSFYAREDRIISFYFFSNLAQVFAEFIQGWGGL